MGQPVSTTGGNILSQQSFNASIPLLTATEDREKMLQFSAIVWPTLSLYHGSRSPGKMAVKALHMCVCVVSIACNAHRGHLSCRLPLWTLRTISRSETREEKQHRVLLARCPRSAPLCHLPAKQWQTRMWANAQRDGRPAEYRRRPVLNAAKFGSRPLLKCRAVTLPIGER